MAQAIRSCLAAVIVSAATAGAAHAKIVETRCGAPIESTTVTNNDRFETTSKAFVRLRGAVVAVRVPSGEQRCIKVRFSGGITCRGNTGSESCFIRALIRDEEFNPETGLNQSLTGRAFTPIGLSYQWVRRVGPGRHLIQIQVRAASTLENIVLGVEDWTMDVETLNVAP